MRISLAFVLLAACSNSADPATGDDTIGDDQPVQDAMPDVAPPLDIIRINEIAAAGSPTDWFEIVNVTGAPVELSDYCFLDDPDEFTKCTAFPAMTLAPNTHVAQDTSTDTTGIGLGGDEELHIYRIADQRLSDSVDWAEGDSPANQSYARIPDITGTFARTNQPTKAAANLADDPTAPLMTLVINEVAADESPDWVEIVNVTSSPIDLALYCFIDSGTTPCAPLAATAGTMLAAGAYHVADATDANATDAGFKLGKGDSVTVKRISDMHVSDTVTWTNGQADPVGTSYARSPNKTGPFAHTTTQSKGAANP